MKLVSVKIKVQQGMISLDELRGLKTLKHTRFATISQQGQFVVKSICKDIAVPPHDSRSELAILKKLSKFHDPHVVELLDYHSDEESLKLLFPFYELDLEEYMRSCYKPPKKRSKMLNPYYALTGDAGHQQQQSTCKNHFDISKHAHDFFLQLSLALQFIHSKGIIHRDLKPQNVLMRNEGCPLLVLTDFGISYDTQDALQTKRESFDAKITDVSTSIYKAPELLFGVRNYTYAVDIWALLILISQWFQEETLWPPTNLPAMVDDGSGQLGDGESGSDIRLILSIFSKLGIPSIQEWEEVARYGSSAAFEGMFGSNGDGNYLAKKSHEDQLQTLYELMPRLTDIEDEVIKGSIERCILGMIPFESSERWDSKRIVEELSHL